MAAKRPPLGGVDVASVAGRAELEEREGRVRVGRVRGRVEGQLQVVAGGPRAREVGVTWLGSGLGLGLLRVRG